ncbi:MAG TPA: hypothetical protein VEZ16_08970 [Microvirga sp.]|nr:hypothetical protein [Microvirga sp.]
MEFLRSVRFLSIPGYVKWLLISLLVAIGVLNTALFTWGILDANRESWVEASLGLLGVVLPLFMLTVVIAKSDVGSEAVTRNTENVLLTVIPEVLYRILERENKFFKPEKKKKLEQPPPSPVKVLVNLVKGECYSDYIIGVPWNKGADPCYKLIIMRLEINVRRINFNMYVSEDVLPQKSDRSAYPDGTILLEAFSHTIGGAALSEAGGGGEPNAQEKRQSGFTFNKSLLPKRLGGRRFYWFVGTKSVSNDFLWDPAEKLFFAQDLVIMLRAFLDESPEFFLEVGMDEWNDDNVLNIAKAPARRQAKGQAQYALVQ